MVRVSGSIPLARTKFYDIVQRLSRDLAVPHSATPAGGRAPTPKLCVRQGSAAGHAAGDFAIILDHCAEDRAKYIAQQLLQALNTLELEWKGSRYAIGASIGLAMNTRDVAGENAWLENADKACYDAKREGRGLLRIATPMRADQLHTRQDRGHLPSKFPEFR
jgi:Diguanylate cyclase, GGDEF domain